MDANVFLADIQEWTDTDLVFSSIKNQEARGNLCCISISYDLAQQISTSALAGTLSIIRDSWQKRLAEYGKSTGNFYAYLDEQASQLRFSLISGVESSLPFGCPVDDSATLEEIVANFLNWPYLEGIPFSELREAHEDAGREEALPMVRVYRAVLEAPLN
ncbi:hypothetical protein [Deinococcus aestuarii]|uniref:hypothetical protein n=1 Tax=Deinococcus aestuarii TaxID=2774531 RepID=UPI001C0CA2F2|nr:hypothetical protein [Deinococcus aestuarii]